MENKHKGDIEVIITLSQGLKGLVVMLLYKVSIFEIHTRYVTFQVYALYFIKRERTTK